jgi:hypothetical protein
MAGTPVINSLKPAYPIHPQSYRDEWDMKSYHPQDRGITEKVQALTAEGIETYEHAEKERVTP